MTSETLFLLTKFLLLSNLPLLQLLPLSPKQFQLHLLLQPQFQLQLQTPFHLQPLFKLLPLSLLLPQFQLPPLLSLHQASSMLKMSLDSSALVTKTESRDAFGVTRGSYQYVDANGVLQTVNYIADP